MNHLRRLGSRFSIRIPPDEHGFTGRECPNPECEGYFKVEFGTGPQGEALPCHCPYCGRAAPHDEFWTKEQIEYGESVVVRKVIDACYKDFKGLEFKHRPRGLFGIGFSLKVKRGRPVPIRYYREEQLETEVVCDRCTLRYAIYGVFAFCPDCSQHNSLQILNKNLDLVVKQLALSRTADSELVDYLKADALENVVSAFDGFGRETCRVHAQSASDPAKVANVSFQNLEGARRRLRDLFGFDLAGGLSVDQWSFAHRCFHKRHVLAHKMGVVDQTYIAATGESAAAAGRKVVVTADEVSRLVAVMRDLGQFLTEQFQQRR